MTGDEELVSLVDRTGREVDAAPRPVVRRDNLLHAATAVLVRDPGGRIYRHRRSLGKDWAPGMWDLAAGGVMRFGEVPREAAGRELAEELGISGRYLQPLGSSLFEDDTTRCFEHVYEVVWDGPITHQPEEVIDGGWLRMTELARLLARPDHDVVPDTVHLLRHLARAGVSDYGTLSARSE